MEFTWKDKMLIAVLLIGALVVTVFLASLSTSQTENFHYGMEVRVTSGFYKGCRGFLIKEVNADKKYEARLWCGYLTPEYFTKLEEVDLPVESFEVLRSTGILR